MNYNKELMGASTSLLVLSVLAKEASYGYRVIKRVNEEADGKFVWQEGTLYPVLHKLEKEGLVRTQWQEAETGRRRKYYYITAKGRDALVERKRQWNDFHVIINRLAEAPNG
jgi:PadR family transcriptional regulator, regulatory protein PadR